MNGGSSFIHGARGFNGLRTTSAYEGREAVNTGCVGAENDCWTVVYGGRSVFDGWSRSVFDGWSLFFRTANLKAVASGR